MFVNEVVKAKVSKKNGEVPGDKEEKASPFPTGFLSINIYHSGKFDENPENVFLIKLA